MVTGGSVAPTAVPCSAPQVDTTPRRPAANRRNKKPMMEKRRRARINNCLNELKALILDAMKKDPARHSKLEKADILEMTVKHLEAMQRQQIAMSAAADTQVLNKFRAGFSECAVEVEKFRGLEPSVKRRLLHHLATCLNSSASAAEPSPPSSTVTSSTSAVQGPPAATQVTGVQVHIVPAVDAQMTASNGIFFSTGGNASLQLVPTRLSNGDIALLLPSASTQILRPIAIPTTSPASSTSTSSSPLLLPIPTRTPSASSASSSPAVYERLTVSTSTNTSPLQTSYPSPSSPSSSIASFDTSDHSSLRSYSPPMQAPLSLVVKKDNCFPEEDVWRPW